MAAIRHFLASYLKKKKLFFFSFVKLIMSVKPLGYQLNHTNEYKVYLSTCVIT